MTDSASPLGEPTPLPPAIEARLDEYRLSVAMQPNHPTVQSDARESAARAALSTEIGKLVEDAERWRYVRDNHLRVRSERMVSGRDRPCLMLDDYALPYDTPTGRNADLNAVIDAARRSTPSATPEETR